MMYRLKDECSSTGNILDQVKYRSEWIKYQEAQKRREEEELEKERGMLVFPLIFPYECHLRTQFDNVLSSLL